MSTHESSAALEQDVETERAALHRTLDQLRINMQPARMAGEILTTVMGRRYEGVTAPRTAGRSIPESLMDLGAAVLFGSSMHALKRSVGVVPPTQSSVEDGFHAVNSEADRTRAKLAGELDRADAKASAASARLAGTIDDIRREASGEVRPSRNLLAEIGTRANDAAARHTGSAALVRTVVDKPVMMGVVGAAIGAAVGLSLAMTRTEDELMGVASANFKKSAREMARERYEQVKDATNQTIDDFRQNVIDHGSA